jgi:hypothetical protein
MKKTLKYFLLFYSFFLVSLISAAVVNHLLKGGQKLNKYKGWILEYAQIPGKAKRFLSDVAGNDNRYIENEGIKDGFTYYLDKTAINNDFLLISTFDPSNINSQVIKLVEIRTNKEIHRWAFNEKIFNNVIDFSSTTRFLHPLLLKDKSLIFINWDADFINTDDWLIKVDSNSRVQWINKDRFNHSIEKEDENTIWTCSRIESLLQDKQISQYVNSSTFGDAITKVDVRSGKILFRKTILSIFQENNLNEVLFSGTIEDDLIHLNDVQPALYKTKYWDKGDLLISIRHKSTILLYRPATNKILWYKTGPWLNQHDCDFYGQSKITLFGNDVVRYNGGDDFIYGTSNQYVFDFETNNVTKPYHKLFTDYQIKTKTEGRSDILTNDDIFIDESNYGRIIIGNKETPKAIYAERIDKKNIKMFNWVRYIKREDFLKVR